MLPNRHLHGESKSGSTVGDDEKKVFDAVTVFLTVDEDACFSSFIRETIS
jgi:hypothetical protein